MPYGEMSGDEMSVRRNVRVMKCPVTIYPVTKCPVTKCLVTKCRVTKCPGATGPPELTHWCRLESFQISDQKISSISKI